MIAVSAIDGDADGTRHGRAHRTGRVREREAGAWAKEFPGAERVESWNSDPARYEKAVTDFVARTVPGGPAPAG